MEAARGFEEQVSDFLDEKGVKFTRNVPMDMSIQFGDQPAIDTKAVPYEELIATVVYWQRIKKGAQAALKEAEERLAKRLTIEGKSSLSVPGFDVTYDYPDKRLWDVEELMAMTGPAESYDLLRVLFGKVTPGQLKAIRDQLENLDDTIAEIIESAERTGRGDKKRLTVQENAISGLGLKEAEG